MTRPDCPRCGGIMTIRTSRPIGERAREVYYRCECGESQKVIQQFILHSDRKPQQ